MNKKFGAAVAGDLAGGRPRHLTRGTIGHRFGRPVLRNHLGFGGRHRPHTTRRGHITNVRTGRHACFDRLVIDLKGKVRGYDVRYVTAVYTEGQGKRVPLAGAADLQIVVRAPAYNSSGNPTYNPSNWAHAKNVSGYTHLQAGGVPGQLRGADVLRPGRPRPAAVQDLRAHRCGQHQHAGDRRGPPLVAAAGPLCDASPPAAAVRRGIAVPVVVVVGFVATAGSARALRAG